LRNGNAKKVKVPTKRRTREMRSEYDFSGGRRGKYVDKYQAGTNVVRPDPKLVEAFPDSKTVNEALRALVAIAVGKPARKRA
jgi:hypothetical protein